MTIYSVVLGEIVGNTTAVQSQATVASDSSGTTFVLRDAIVTLPTWFGQAGVLQVQNTANTIAVDLCSWGGNRAQRTSLQWKGRLVLGPPGWVLALVWGAAAAGTSNGFGVWASGYKFSS